MGSNMAEAHPVGFQWVMEAKARGTQVVHIDPRFTRTSAVADKHVPLRAGSDIAFLGGVINYILSNELDFREYVTAYTNASFIVDERLPGHRGPRRTVQRLRRRDRIVRPVVLALRIDESVGHDRKDERSIGSARFGWRADRGRSPHPRRSDAAAPALRVPDPQAALRPLHAGDGGADLRRACRSVPRDRQGVGGELGTRTHRGAGVQRRVGRSTRSAPSTSAPARSSNCCWATSAVPAVA